MSFFKKKAGVTVIVVAVIAALLTVITHFTGENPVSNAVRAVFAPFRSGR